MTDPGAQTIREIAAALGVNPASLRVHVWRAGFKADGTRKEGRQITGTFSQPIVDKIVRFLEKCPIKERRGRPKKVL